MIKIAYSDRYVLELPDAHRFPMLKYELVCGQLLHEGVISTDNLYESPLLSDDVIELTHSKEYWDALVNNQVSDKDMRKVGFPYSKKLINRSRSSAGGTLQSAKFALKYGVGLNIAGGTHHAFKDRGEAFCLLNDIAIASNYLLEEAVLNRVGIFDFDVHQGNGTAKIFEDDPRVFTTSIHGESNYPREKCTSDLDIGLPVGTSDSDYLSHVDHVICQMNLFNPQIIFYQAGVDILETDKLGTLSISKEGCKQRDEKVVSYAHENRIPLVVTMGGGYSPKLPDIVEAHCNTFKIVFEYFD